MDKPQEPQTRDDEWLRKVAQDRLDLHGTGSTVFLSEQTARAQLRLLDRLASLEHIVTLAREAADPHAVTQRTGALGRLRAALRAEPVPHGDHPLDSYRYDGCPGCAALLEAEPPEGAKS